MSKLDHNVPKVLGLVCHRPPDQIRIPLYPGLLLRCVPYPIRCSLRILLFGLQGRQWLRGLGKGGRWDKYLRTDRLRRKTSMEGGILVDEWLGGIWDVTLSFFLLFHLVVQHPAVQHGYRNSRIYIMEY